MKYKEICKPIPIDSLRYILNLSKIQPKHNEIFFSFARECAHFSMKILLKYKSVYLYTDLI